MKSINIVTSNQIPISYETATYVDRLLSFIIDFIVIYFSFIILVSVESILLRFDNPYGLRFFYISNIILICFYTLISETLMDGQTIGKKALGIKVIKINGEKLNFMDYFIRWTFRLVDIYLSLGSVATLLINSSEKKQRLGDIIALTAVIRLRTSKKISLKEILSISSSSDYIPVYLFVKDFNEDEMLMIKDLIDRRNEFQNDAYDELIEELVTNISRKYNIQKPSNNQKFLSTLIKDYIVLTR